MYHVINFTQKKIYVWGFNKLLACQAENYVLGFKRLLYLVHEFSY